MFFHLRTPSADTKFGVRVELYRCRKVAQAADIVDLLFDSLRDIWTFGLSARWKGSRRHVARWEHTLRAHDTQRASRVTAARLFATVSHRRSV